MKKLICVIPTLQIGGAETALVSAIPKLNQDFDLRVIVLGKINSNIIMSLSEDEKMKIIQFHVFPFHYFPALIFSLKFKPDIVVNNLWPSAPLSLMIKLFRPKIKLVEFTHNTKFFHFFDKFFSKLVLACCYCCCCSKATKVFLEKEKIRKPFKVLSLLRISSPKIWKPKKQIKLKAMFLGRFSEQKRIDRIIEMVGIFHNNGLKFEVDLFGRDNGTMDFVKQKVKDLGLENFIKFIGEISPNEVYNIFPNYDFYFQTSKFEGTAMSVMEAMQYGLICVVTNVGDIKNYCQDGKNSILIDGNLENFDESNLLSVITQLKKITTDINFANKLSKNAYLTWKNQKPFSESFLKALKEI